MQYVSEELRRDRGFILEAPRQNYEAMKFASAELRGDIEVIPEAVDANWLTYVFATGGHADSPDPRRVAFEALRRQMRLIRPPGSS